MTQQIINFLAQNPLYLGLGLLVGAALWLLMAAFLSLLIPVSDEPDMVLEIDTSWESAARLPSSRYDLSYDGPQALSSGTTSPIWFKPSEPAAPAFSQVRSFPAAATNLAPVAVEEKPATAANWVLKERLESLADKLDTLERPALAPDFSRFEEKVSRLTDSLNQIQKTIHSVSNFEEEKVQLEERLDLLSRRFLDRIDKMAEIEAAPETAKPIGENIWREIDAAVGQARQERERLLHQHQEAEAEALRRAEELKRIDAEAAQQARETISKEEETLTANRQELDKAWTYLETSKREFQENKAAEPPLVSLDDLRAGQEKLQARLLSLNEQQETERQRQEKFLARLRRRLTLWQTGWRTRLAGDQSRWDEEWQTLEKQRAATLASLEQERAALRQRLAALREEESRLANAQESFQKNIVEAWDQEKAVHNLEVQHLTEQSASIEAGIQDVQARMAAEKARFDDMVRENRESLRAKQAEWKQELKALQDEFQEKSVQAKAAIAQETENFEKEKIQLTKKETADNEALARQLAEWQASQGAALEQISQEKAEWDQKISQWSARVQELEKVQQELESAYVAERSEQAQRVSEQRSRTEQRLDNLRKLLESVRQNIADQLGQYAREKNVITADLRRAREDFQQRAAMAVSDLENKRKALDQERREAEAEHAAFLARSWDDEQKLKKEIDALEKETSVLQKKLDVFRGRRQRVIDRLQERHERILLKLHQEVDQQKVQGESRIAEEKIALETVKARLANRQSRLHKVLQKQDEQLQTIFQELNGTLELVRQGHRSESQVWLNRIKSLQNQKELWLKRRESMRTTTLVSQEMQEKEKQELERFEKEEARLRKEREQYWQSIVEFSAVNQEALRRLMDNIKGSGDDLDRREALAVEITSRIREQLTQVRSFQSTLRPFDSETKN